MFTTKNALLGSVGVVPLWSGANQVSVVLATSVLSVAVNPSAGLVKSSCTVPLGVPATLEERGSR